MAYGNIDLSVAHLGHFNAGGETRCRWEIYHPLSPGEDVERWDVFSVVVRLISPVISGTSPVSFRQAKLCNLRHAPVYSSVQVYTCHRRQCRSSAGGGRS